MWIMLLSVQRSLSPVNITFLVVLQLSEGLIKLAAGRAEPSLDFYLFSWASPATWSLEMPKVLACHAAEIVFRGEFGAGRRQGRGSVS